MQDIIIRLREVLDSGITKEKELIAKLSEVNKRASELQAFSDQLKKKEADLIEREIEVRNVSNILSIAEETAETRKRIEDDMREIKIQRAALISSQERAAKEQSDKARMLDEREKEINARLAKAIKHESEFERLINEKVKEIINKK